MHSPGTGERLGHGRLRFVLRGLPGLHASAILRVSPIFPGREDIAPTLTPRIPARHDLPIAAQPPRSSYKVEILALLGKRTEAESLLREILQRRSTGERPIEGDRISHFMLLRNQREEALAALDSHYRTASDVLQSKVQLRHDPRWDPLRGDPRFRALLKAPERNQ